MRALTVVEPGRVELQQRPDLTAGEDLALRDISGQLNFQEPDGTLVSDTSGWTDSNIVNTGGNDASSPAAVAHLFEEADGRLGTPDVVMYNASARAHGPIAELDPEAVRKAVEISAFGAFLVIQQAARRMIPRGSGAILLTGASASVKGYPHSAAFAMGKFALRGLAQSTARELGPKGIHVAHFVID